MKKYAFPVLLSAIIISASSFKLSDARYNVRIDGADFDARVSDNYSARVVKKETASSSVNTALITLHGNGVKDKHGNVSDQKIYIEYDFETATIVSKKIVFEFKNTKYYNLPGNTKFNVTKMEWSADKKSFVISATFDCMVQKLRNSENYEGIISMQGTIENMIVRVPAPANANHTASAE